LGDGYRTRRAARKGQESKPLDFALSFAELASTYGWTHREILSLTARQFFLYLRQVYKLDSFKQLKAFEASLIPYLERTSRDSVFASYRETLNTVSVDTSKVIDEAWDSLRKRGGSIQ